MSGPQCYWTDERIVAAFHAWAETNGRAPRMNDWLSATHDHPAAQTVRERFGSWSAGVRAAGYTPNRPGMPPIWTKHSIAEWILDFRFTVGRWPTIRDWEEAAGTGRPCLAAVRRVFGTWTAARQYAGHSPRCVVCTTVVSAHSRVDRLYCSPVCKRAAERNRKLGIVPARVLSEPGVCVGCGGEHGSRTIGCRHCQDRARKRARSAPGRPLGLTLPGGNDGAVRPGASPIAAPTAA